MREIKFRGFDAVGNKGWVYGDLVHNKKVNKEEPFLTDRIMVGGYEVFPESVGQFIGLRDKERNEIYKGDIVQCGDFVYEVVYCEYYASFGLRRSQDMYMHYFGEAMKANECQVIGNIYENKELPTNIAK